MNSKNLFTTKTFWFNLLAIIITAIVQNIGQLHLDPTTAIAVLGILNILLRLVTKTSAHVIPEERV